MIVWYSVYFLLKRPKLFIAAAVLLLFGILYAGWEIYQNRALIIAKPNTPQSLVKNTDVPTVSGNIIDGNSVFSPNILDKMQPFERQAYSKQFYIAMEEKKTGEEHRWQIMPEVFGAITPGESFKSGSGVDCRHFSELISVKGHNQSIRGMSCRRTEGGWCKLRPGSVPICGMKEPGAMRLWMHEKTLKVKNWF